MDVEIKNKELNNEEYDKEWKEKLSMLLEYKDSSEKSKNYFEKNGRIPKSAVIIKDGKKINIGRWLCSVYDILMSKYRGMTIEEIEENPNISKIDKSRMILLLKSGVKYRKEITREKTTDNNMIEKINEYKKFMELSEEERKRSPKRKNMKTWRDNRIAWLKKIEERKTEKSPEELQEEKELKERLAEVGIVYIKLKTNEEKFQERMKEYNEYRKLTEEEKKKYKNRKSIELWKKNLQFGFMRKYQGMSKEEVENDPNIPPKDKKRMVQLLDAGVEYLNTKEEYTDNIWQENFDMFIKYINSSEEILEKFKKTGTIPIGTKMEAEGKCVEVGNWLSNQKYQFMVKYQDMTIEEIENDESIPESDKKRMIKLLNAGVTYKKLRVTGQKIGQATFDSKVIDCDAAEKVFERLENQLVQKNFTSIEE